MTTRKATLTALAVVLGLALAANAQQEKDNPHGLARDVPSVPQAKHSPPGRHMRYAAGDVFVSVGTGQVIEFTPTGTIVQILDDTTGSTYTAGSAFDKAGNFYVTNFSLGSVSEFDVNGNLVNANFISGTGQVTPESISMPGGNFPLLLGDADFIDQNGNGVISQYDSTGALLMRWSVQRENRGTDWVDLQPDLCTVLYTSEGISILSYNICTSTQNPDFATGLPGSNDYAHRTLGSGPFMGDDLVADSAFALAVAMGGGIVETYTLPGNAGEDFALNLDPNGTAFWTADLASGEVWEVDIATGTILQQWNSGFPGSTGGLAVFKEPGQGVPPCAIPACVGR